MRLSRVEHNHRFPQRLMLTIIGLASGGRPPDIVTTLLYRPEFFGRPISNWFEEIMRGPSPWTPGERELFASFTSKMNQCPF